MKEKHYNEKLSAFLDHELSAEEKQKVGEHILHCQECRKEHDEIKFAGDLAKNLERTDAPSSTWRNIEAELEGKKVAVNFFKPRFLAAAFASLIVIFGLAAVFYLNFPNAQPPETAKNINAEEKTAWAVENISKDSTENALLKVGEILETDENSSAKIEVADIGQVEIAPNSLVKLVGSSEKEHRIALEYGSLEAKIFAPPRLFVVDTPTAQAVDLGCAYKLDVDKAGNSTLHVTSGYVALERDGRESIVPAGAFCMTRRGRGLGTPYFEAASDEFQAALRKFDFDGGGGKYLQTLIKTARSQDTLTLWHLLSRVPESERENVLEKILSFAKLPEGVTREGVLSLDKNMLDQLRYELEMSWFE